MDMEAGEYEACTLLSLCARKAGVFLVNLASKEPPGDAQSETIQAPMADLGTRLFALSSFLADPTSPIGLAIDKDAENRTAGVDLERDPARIASDIQTRLDDWDHNSKEKQAKNYFRSCAGEVETLGHLCDALRSKVTSKTWHATASLPATVKVPKPNRYNEIINKRLFNTVKRYTRCAHKEHWEYGGDMPTSCIGTWLPTRLRLGGPIQAPQEEWARFDVVTSSLKEKFWNEFCWHISTELEDDQTSERRSPRVKFLDVEGESQYHLPTDPVCLSPGVICEFLSPVEASICIELQLLPDMRLIQRDNVRQVDPLFPHEGVNLSGVLQNYDPLTVKDKITLSHTLAQAFWQLYASDLMQAVWTSEDIWFMHVHKADENGDPIGELPEDLPMNAYVTFNFGDIANAVEESRDSLDWSRPRPLPHRFPHILALGALLLEIGIGKPVGKRDIRSLLSRDHVVRAISAISSNLEKLEKAKWDGFALHKIYFTSAIRYCTSNSNLPSRPHSSPKGSIGHKSTAERPHGAPDISKRKDMLYENVIRPLAWLAQAFHEDDNVTCPYMSSAPYIRRLQEPSNPTGNLPGLPQLIKSSGNWFNTLRTFNHRILQLAHANDNESRWRCPKPKIAILDTGYKSNMGCFKDYRNSGMITWHDLASDPPSSEGIDEDGHGSFMAHLVLASAPLAAEVYVVRVARNRQDILQRKSKIAEAIKWAGLSMKVDIISMSFGFEADDDSVREMYDAIDEVDHNRERRVIFFAAASNDSSHQTDMFPARHPSVIPIHATNDQGVFVFNPSIRGCILGTFSDGLPSEILTEMKQDFGITIPHRPSSSFATAIATSIAGATLAHISALGRLYSSSNQGGVAFTVSPVDVLAKLKTQCGMRKAVQGMATESGARQDRLFLNPIAFWKRASKNTSSDLQMHVNILKGIDYYVTS